MKILRLKVVALLLLVMLGGEPKIRPLPPLGAVIGASVVLGCPVIVGGLSD